MKRLPLFVFSYGFPKTSTGTQREVFYFMQDFHVRFHV